MTNKSIALAMAATAALAAGSTWGVAGRSNRSQPSDSPIVAAPSPSTPKPRTSASPAFEKAAYYPYSNSGWSEFFGEGGAVVETAPGVRAHIDCEDLTLPLFDGRVDDDAVGYELRLDDRVLKYHYFVPARGHTLGGWIAYGDSDCRDELRPEIDRWIRYRLEVYARTGESAADLPGGL